MNLMLSISTDQNKPFNFFITMINIIIIIFIIISISFIKKITAKNEIPSGYNIATTFLLPSIV